MIKEAMHVILKKLHFARLQPLGAFRTELLQGSLVVFLHVLFRELILPPTVGPLVDERAGSSVPERATEGDAWRGIGLHVFECAVLDDCIPFALVDWDFEKGGELADFTWHILLQIAEVEHVHVWQLTDRPPRPDVLPERPPRVSIAVDPFVVVLKDRVRRLSYRGPHEPRRLVQCGIPLVVGRSVVIVHAPRHVTTVTANVNIPGSSMY